MEENESMMLDIGIPKLPWPVLLLSVVFMALSPFAIMCNFLKMGRDWYNGNLEVFPAKAAPKTIEEDSEFVRVKPKKNDK